jgi:secondary thiamine-phosphate synthase enzyme
MRGMKRETMNTALSDRSDMKLYREVLQLQAESAPEFIDITSSVLSAVEASQVQEGTVTIFSRHTTAAVKINENEPLLLGDMATFLERFAPRDADYRHNDFEIRTANMTEDECPNGHAHCQHLLLSASETIPIVSGRAILGKWQSVFVIELDRPREREIVVQVQGW